MGRAGGNYEQPKKGNKKQVSCTQEADQVDGNSTRLEEQAKAEKETVSVSKTGKE